MAFYRPAPVNQFYQLDRDTPTSPYVKTNRWNHIHANASGNVSNWDPYLCMAGEGAVALDAHTQGRYRFSPGSIHDRQSDRLGGIGVDDVADAFATVGQTLLTPDYYSWADTLTAVKGRRHVAIGVDYGKVPYEYQSQKGGDFSHALGIDEYRSSDSRVLVYDTLATNPRWWPQSAIRPAAEALALQERGNAGRLFVGLTMQRPAIEPSWLVTISGYVNLYGVPNGSRVGAVSKATYRCSRSKVSGEWWYRIWTKGDGTATGNQARYFQPNRYVKAELL